MLTTASVRAQAQCLFNRMSSGGRGGTGIQEKAISIWGGEDEEGEAGSVDRKGQGEKYCQKRSIPPGLGNHT